MSRFEWDEYEQEFNNQAAFWELNAQRALKGKRGKQALRELREALMALPERRLIAGALCTVGGFTRTDMVGAGEFRRADVATKLASEGEGVCAMGAFLWHRKVKAGTDPAVAFDELPMLLDSDGGGWETADAGRAAGLTYPLAWQLAYRNDESFSNMTPEERFTAFVGWIDEQLGLVT